MKPLRDFPINGRVWPNEMYGYFQHYNSVHDPHTALHLKQTVRAFL